MAVGFVTCAELGGITGDDALAAALLQDAGVEVRSVLWDRRPLARDLDAIVLRSPWNYHLDPDAFLAWVDTAAHSALVCNDPATVRWNAHKSYLFDLAKAGIPVPETILCKQGEPADLRAIMREREWDRVVVKPAISASSYMTAIVGRPVDSARHEEALEGRVVADGQPLLERILQTRDALVQPFMAEILERGERCLIFIDGAFSHAVQKAPFTSICGLGDPAAAEPGEVELAERALAVLPEAPLYARVDILRNGAGVDCVTELELIDPELYLRFGAGSPERLAAALLRRL